MKRLFTQSVIITSLLVLLITSAQAQPDYVFKNPVLKSGTDLQPGAVYKFLNVKSNVDANVTILLATGGVTLNSIDENWTGFDEALQPFINVGSSANGYVELRIDFLNGGTETLKNQGQVPATCIDVDGVLYGDGVLYEQDQIEFLGGTYDFSMTGANLQVLNPPGWITVKNTSGISYGGVDTIQKDVMATVTNKSISSFKIRIGALNTSPTKSEVRYRSVYFKKFTYSNSILLPNRTTLNFSGAWNTNGVQIKGTFSASHTFDRMIIERGSSSATIMSIGEISLLNTNSSEYAFKYLDNTAGGDINYYRIRLVNSNQRIYELSSIIMVKKGNGTDSDLKLVNTMVSSSIPVVSLYSHTEQEASVQVADMSGRLVYVNKILMNSGTNNITLNNFNAGNGYFVIVVKTKNKTLSQKISIQ